MPHESIRSGYVQALLRGRLCRGELGRAGRKGGVALHVVRWLARLARVRHDGRLREAPPRRTRWLASPWTPTRSRSCGRTAILRCRSRRKSRRRPRPNLRPWGRRLFGESGHTLRAVRRDTFDSVSKVGPAPSGAANPQVVVTDTHVGVTRGSGCQGLEEVSPSPACSRVRASDGRRESRASRR